MDYTPKLNVVSMVYPVHFEVVRNDVRQATSQTIARIQPQKPQAKASTIPLRQNNEQTLPRFINENSAENTA
ncbi:MAG: hypothetical protein IJS88_00290 [Alphaproteobacteria bacterium]|nr:hypothetical protein [Alphaproteobacteria bacterium]